MSDPSFRHAGDLPDAAGQALPLGRSLIAVIGINAYTPPDDLKNARQDAESILEVFTHCGFTELPEAPSLFDEQATLSALNSLVREQLPPVLKPDDCLVLFYAGHGATIKSETPDPRDASKMVTHYNGYLIPVDVGMKKRGGWLPLDTFLEDIARLPARHVLVILDACSSGLALSEKFKPRGEGQAPGTLAELAGKVSRRVITSATQAEKAMDGGGSGNSLFTETLVDAIDKLKADTDGDGFITTTELFSYVRKQVGDTAIQVHNVQQTPDYGFLPYDGSGELVLSLSGDIYNRKRAEVDLQVAERIYELGWLSGDAKRFASAIRYYKEAHKLAGVGRMPLPAARLGLGKALLAAGQAAEAATELAELVKSEGDAAPAETQLYLGLARAKSGQYAPAAEALRAWQGRHADSPDAAWVGAYADWLAQAARPAAGRKLALLVGINEYRVPNLNRLNGCVNDVRELMQPALIRHGGFKPDDVTAVTDADATRARFRQEMQKLQSATLSDAVVVFFSGHSILSSQVVDERTEKYYNDVYLILSDTHEDSGCLTDGVTADELHQWMQDIPAGRKTLILDTHASERFMELARSEGSYALILASDTAEVAYEWQVDVAGKLVPCGMLTGALYQALLAADDQTLSYGDWITAAIRIAETASSDPAIYVHRQTPYFSGIKKQRVFGPDDLYWSVFEFSQRHDWPELSGDELTKLYAMFCQGISVPHPQGHAAFGRAFLSKGAAAQAVAALQTAMAQGGDALPANLLALAQARLQGGQPAAALDALHRYTPLAAPAEQTTVQELDGLLGKLTTRRKHALLVGIDKYQSAEVPRLKGARNDVAALQQILTQRWGFQAEDVVELVHAKATRAAILAEFKRLVGLAREGPALFFFAGHGSHDQDGLPTLVPYDGRQADVPDIALEELANLVGQDATNLVAMLDTGFSGRALQATDRTVKPDRRAPWAQARFASNDERLAYLKTLRIGAATVLEGQEMR